MRGRARVSMNDRFQELVTTGELRSFQCGNSQAEKEFDFALLSFGADECRVRRSVRSAVLASIPSGVNYPSHKKREGDISREISPSLSDFSKIRFGNQITMFAVGDHLASTSRSPRFPRSSQTTLTARVFLCHPFPVARTESRYRFSEMTVTPLSPSGRSLFR